MFVSTMWHNSRWRKLAVQEIVKIVPVTGVTGAINLLTVLKHLENAKISAVHSLADICFLHVIILLIRCIIESVCASVFKWCLSGVRSYSSFGSVNAYHPQFCFVLILSLLFSANQTA